MIIIAIMMMIIIIMMMMIMMITIIMTISRAPLDVRHAQQVLNKCKYRTIKRIHIRRLKQHEFNHNKNIQLSSHKKIYVPIKRKTVSMYT